MQTSEEASTRMNSQEGEDLGQGRFLKSRNRRRFVGEKKEEEERKRMELEWNDLDECLCDICDKVSKMPLVAEKYRGITE